MSAQPDLKSAAATRAVRLGFLGLGWIGRKRLDALAGCEGVEIAALCDADAQRRHAAASAHAGAVEAASLEALLACDLDGVVIATPNAFHAEQALACLANGLAVFCQKPLASSLAATDRVLAAARDANCLLGIDYCYRHVRGMPQLKARIGSGELGEIMAIDLVFHNAYGPDKAWCYDRRLAGGGCLLDLGVHLIDLALWLQDAPPMRLMSSRLFAQGRAVRGGDGPIEDLAFAQLRQANGALVRLACSWHAHVGRDALIGMQILGTHGGAAWRNVDGSFYDFELDICHGTARERIASPPDDWGARALSAWARRLSQDASFDPQAMQIARGAALIDEIYRA